MKTKPKLQDEIAFVEGRAVFVPAGTIALEIDSTKKSAPKYRFNSDVTLQAVGEHTLGCGEFQHGRVLVVVDGKRLSIRKS